MAINKLDENKLEFPLLRIETVNRLRLGRFWNNVLLTGHHWRLYHHDAAGAALRIGSQTTPMRPDRLYLLPPYCNVRGVCEVDPGPEQLFIHFQLTGFSGNMEYRCNALELTPDLRRQLEMLYREMERDSGSGRCNLTAIALASTAMIELPDRALTELEPDRGIQQLCDRMLHEPAEDWSLKQLSRLARMPEQTLLKRFREVTGSTPCQFLQHLRYARAARLLQTTDMAIEDICEYIGVKDRFHFSRRFKTMYGAPPVMYRKRYRS